MSVKAGLPPIAGRNARLFLLGSLPSDASLAARRYYAHPTNQFWRLLGNVLGEDLQVLGYEARLEILAQRRIGLWDVIASANRPGSLDQAIRSAAHNQIARWLRNFPDLRAIAFNGSAAAAAGRKAIGEPPPGLVLVDLPSSSAANTRRFASKLAEWAVLRQFLEQEESFACAAHSSRHDQDHDSDAGR